ncbi:MAG: hypothetical protein AB7G48_13790 [Nitrospiraceae bacterium]
MPLDNNFQHAEYSRAEPKDRVIYRELTSDPHPDSPAWADAMARQGTELARGGVRLVVLLHGSLLGADLFGMQRLDEAGGLKRGYSRGIAGLDALLSQMREATNGLAGPPGWPHPPYRNDAVTKTMLDETLADAGNVTERGLQLFRKGINRELSKPIVCERYLWSCEHHHLGRAQAACRLLDDLHRWTDDLQLGPGDRLLVHAHGQAGLLLALASNLLAPERLSGYLRFFAIQKEVARQNLSGTVTVELLESLDRRLRERTIFNGATLDLVTFGTPVRYGWDPAGVGKILHIVNQRMLRIDGKAWLAKAELPQITMELPIAWGGDYVQQLAVAGTDAKPASSEAQAANKALWEFLEPWDGFERWLECVRRSVRCQNDGLCMLVDYKDSTGSTQPRDHYYGHAAYSRQNAMLFNISEIARALYT